MLEAFVDRNKDVIVASKGALTKQIAFDFPPPIEFQAIYPTDSTDV